MRYLIGRHPHSGRGDPAEIVSADYADVRLGTGREIRLPASYFRSSPSNGHEEGPSACLKWATSGPKLLPFLKSASGRGEKEFLLWKTCLP